MLSTCLISFPLTLILIGLMPFCWGIICTPKVSATVHFPHVCPCRRVSILYSRSYPHHGRTLLLFSSILPCFAAEELSGARLGAPGASSHTPLSDAGFSWTSPPPSPIGFCLLVVFRVLIHVLPPTVRVCVWAFCIKGLVYVKCVVFNEKLRCTT